MYEWNEMVQRMIDWIDSDLTDAPTLLRMSEQLGYSPYYCTRQFHALTGMTVRDYIRLRRISRAALELRDTDDRILDIAVKYGFSSHEAFSRAFVKAFRLTPGAYRAARSPIPLAIRAEVFSPYHYLMKEREKMREVHLQAAEIKLEFIPDHKFIGIWDPDSVNYGGFWNNGHNCDEVSGTLESMSHHTLEGQLGQTAGWFYVNGRKGYLYGIPVSADYTGEVPEGMECRDIPASEYLVFFHPPFDYLQDNGAVMRIVEEVAWSYDPAQMGYVWDEEMKQDYQRHFPEGYGYAVLRPVKKAGSE
ncbi:MULTISPECIES: AraC family transcriptional regulator [unclassified Paenibacillus]|uniref:AraC family transcriptional regulator n=1 Tax=unclassified Paenibacillus TaxID=185978 RepID=UPI0024049B4E|nr:MULTISPECIES: AraC family transcriptional regulator [unclassified Paenibacillus]MDF9840788.1 AraC family transcriptional regulator [Paenibacillus sp. PastF-2]MDF9847371.1 AraC family transcriptional regulator [Paenibacillus sp. PastM-2]MDF9854051.1 AraC family transcriptional regulator [Paenibacillus sp. PastF-1]MDH6479324.1 AraC family transcriptional regulator [Paenibacillus sp. PastH-2]MDH6506943.1 AraC family transcriptional regulator [Paenibacillus sp. PastM-3]